MKQDIAFKNDKLMVSNAGGGQTVVSGIIAISDQYMQTLVDPELYIPTQYLDNDIDF